MTSPSAQLDTLGRHVPALARAHSERDADAFAAAVDALVRERADAQRDELDKLTSALSGALDQFCRDTRLVDLAEREVPDARQRLQRVLELTDEAAHRTLDLVEQSCPLAENIRRRVADARATLVPATDPALQVLVNDADADAERIRANLNEVLMTQGYQDLTGQILRSVMQLVGEIESTLAELLRLNGGKPPASDVAVRNAAPVNGHGPVVPGVAHGTVVSGQQDIDALLSSLGV